MQVKLAIIHVEKKKGLRVVLNTKLSISFTLGKASQPNKVNIKHNNRDFIANNIKMIKTADNITFKSENVEDAYHKLFDQALEEYNANQKKKIRRIDNYYDHVCNDKRKEAFYEAIVQFGDINTANVDSEMGKQCIEMLCEYMNEFQKRNPNLYVFNAVLHVDEATPHLHIDFIPFYNNPDRIKGLKKGVSMKSALLEQGYTCSGKVDNNVVKFEQAERDCMEQILNQFGMERDNKHAYYEHMTVSDYKERKEIERHKNILNKAVANADKERFKNAETFLKIQALEIQLAEMKKQQKSPYQEFVYSSHDKLSYVLARMNDAGIDYVETSKGFKAKDYFKKQIRQFEKEFVPTKVNYRDQLREDIDRLVMQSANYNDVTEGLKNLGYEVSKRSYVSVRPQGSKQFIRLNSLGAEYSVQGIKNRIEDNELYKQNIVKEINVQHERKIYIGVLQNAQFYFDAFCNNHFPMVKVRKYEPFSWKNDAQLDRLAKINKLVNDGADIDTFNQRYEDAVKSYDELYVKIESLEKKIKVNSTLYNCANIIYGGSDANDKQYNFAKYIMNKNPMITKDNYKSLFDIISNDKQELAELKKQYDDLKMVVDETKEQLDAIESIYKGTYMQSLLRDANIETYADEIPSGFDEDFLTI